MVDRDGRAHVLDFGLVRAAHESADGDRVLQLDPSQAAASTTGSFSSLDQELTAVNTLLGTPAYMSPEQHLRELAGPKSDQFSFCVVVYELLYGVRPFVGRSQQDIMTAIFKRRFTTAPESRRVPPSIRRALLRGLEVDPAQRWPSMDELLDALTRDPAQRRRRVLGAGVVLALAGLVAFGVSRRLERRAALCSGGAAEIAEVWGPERAAEVRGALAATELGYAADVAGRVVEHLDADAAAWATMRDEACLSHQRGVQSGELLDLRMACLDRARGRMEALTRALSRADGEVVEKAVQATLELPPIERCADVELLQASVRPPEDPKTAASVSSLRAELDDARTLDSTGKYDEGLARARALEEEIGALGYEPLIAEFYLTLGHLLKGKGDYKAAQEAEERAFFTARGCGHDEVAIEAASDLIVLVGEAVGDLALGERWARHAAAEVHTVGTSLQRAAMLNGRGLLRLRQGHYDEALADHEQALALREAELPPGHPAIAESLGNLGAVHFNLGEFERARTSFQRAVDIMEEALGADHPQLAGLLNRLSVAHARLQDADRALEVAGRALAIQEQALGPSHPKLADILFNTATIEYRAGRPQEAILHLRRALAIGERTYGAEHHHIADYRSILGGLLNMVGDREEALLHLRRAKEIAERALGAEHPRMAPMLENLAEAENDAGAYREAGEHARAALKLRVAAKGEGSAEAAAAELELARALEGQGRGRDALAHAEAAVQGYEGGLPRLLARARFVLARALEGRGERERARELIDAAESGLAAGGWEAERDLEALRAFRAALAGEDGE